MSAVARGGRTVLFVSHNMGAVLDLCTHGALLEQGKLLRDGRDRGGRRQPTSSKVSTAGTGSSVGPVRPGDAGDLRGARSGGPTARRPTSSTTARLSTSGSRRQASSAPEFGLELKIKNSLRQPVAYATSWIGGERRLPVRASGSRSMIPRLPFAEDTYYVDFVCRQPHGRHVDNWWDSISFRVVNARPGVSPVTVQASDQLGAVVLEDATFKRATAIAERQLDRLEELLDGELVRPALDRALGRVARRSGPGERRRRALRRSPAGTTRPFTPSSTRSAPAPTRSVTITGQPHASASFTTTPHGSRCDGTTVHSASA